jgi:hypothetical protein
MVAVALSPAASYAMTVRVSVPLAVLVLFQLRL